MKSKTKRVEVEEGLFVPTECADPEFGEPGYREWLERYSDDLAEQEYEEWVERYDEESEV